MKKLIKRIRRFIYSRLIGKKKMSELIQFQVLLSQDCNLNCKGCAHFAPLAPKNTTYDLNNYTKDIERLSTLFHGKANWIRLMGGEPLLNKDINKYIILTRKYFPDTEILLVTNGIKLKDMEQDFWDACRSNHVIIAVTYYPMDLNYKELEELVTQKGVSYRPFTFKDQDTSFRNISLDINKPENNKKRFYNCWLGNSCICLVNSRLYPFSIPANISLYNKYYGQEFNDSSRNSIDIHKATGNEILDFLRTPMEFCSYCSSKQKKMHWNLSKRDKKEWTV